MRSNCGDGLTESVLVNVKDLDLPVTVWGALEPRAAVVIHPATGVSARIYRGLASYLASNGYAVVTYEYRGSSGSAREHPGVRMRDWMNDEVPALAEWARKRWPELPQLAIGHSIGGHALALDRGSRELAGFVTIASHAGVTRTVATRTERARVWLMLSILGPALSHTMGVFPARRLGLGEDLPKAAMLEWSRWSRLPGYFFDDPTMDAAQRAAAVTTAVLAIGFTDDLWATPSQIDAITDHLVNAHVTRVTWSPDDGGVSSIGHMGFTRSELAETLWPALVEWLDQRVAEVDR